MPKKVQGEPGGLGVAEVVFLVVSGVAPVSGAVALIPLAVGFGAGRYTAGTVLLVTVALILFAVGYVRMVGAAPGAGGLATCIEVGLGPVPGKAAAFVAVTAYLATAAAVLGALGYFCEHELLRLVGIRVPWWVFSIASLAVAHALTYFRVSLTARIMGVLLIASLIVIAGLDLAVAVQLGPSAFALDSLRPDKALSAPAAGIGLIYGFAFFHGIEGAANYSEEMRRPEHTLPRATYLGIVALGAFFIVTSMAVVGALGDSAVLQARSEPGQIVYRLADRLIAPAWADAVTLVFIVSSFLGVIAFHNMVSRYLLSLARDRCLPAALARVHPRHRSPVAASAVSFAVLALVTAAFAWAGLDPLTDMSAALTGVGTVGVLALLAVLSATTAGHFSRRGEVSWPTVFAPALAAVCLLAVVILSLVDYHDITGTKSAVVNALPVLLAAAAVVGFLVGRRHAVQQPESPVRSADSIAAPLGRDD